MGAGASVASSLVAVWAAWGGASKPDAPAAAAPAFDDALDAVVRAAEAVAEYLRAVMDAACSAAVGAAAWALEKLEEAAAFVLDRVVRLLRRLRGRKEFSRRAAARRAGPDVFAETASRVARSGRCIMGPAASSAVVVVPAAAAAAPGALALPGSVSGSDVARRAARSAAGMMGLILEAFPAEAHLRDSIPAAARSSITVIAAAAAVCLDVVASTDTNA
ncbi:hypothetical protein PAHAL_9G431000 [Panicum hallii]|jgi:hypothetical protein|uniref:Rx N-terminal domain-containing protein n=1 Tax=Panicum hallii TaxID=206008 RepID=A0A2T8I4G3_9POAL|nr:uncharacterized protein LOC112873205 [Panicum hallii]PVH32566.1 hypothetical protein PAHAL_9G431000 [Panicum hallii]